MSCSVVVGCCIDWCYLLHSLEQVEFFAVSSSIDISDWGRVTTVPVLRSSFKTPTTVPGPDSLAGVAMDSTFFIWLFIDTG